VPVGKFKSPAINHREPAGPSQRARATRLPIPSPQPLRSAGLPGLALTSRLRIGDTARWQTIAALGLPACKKLTGWLARWYWSGLDRSDRWLGSSGWMRSWAWVSGCRQQAWLSVTTAILLCEQADNKVHPKLLSGAGA